MKVLGPGDQPFMTEDSILAFALYLAGVEFCDNKMPCFNVYTEAKLKELYEGSGMLPQAAAIQAVKDGNKGTISYLFRSPNQQLIAAFFDQKTILEKSEGLANQIVANLMSDFITEARPLGETIVRLVCTIVYMRGEFLRLWKFLEPLIKIDEALERTEENLPDGSKVVSCNGFKYIGAYASETTKKKMDLC